MLTLPVLVLPGLGNSGPDHWQSQWERRDPQCRRVLQDEWDNPDCADWVARLDAELAQQDAPVVLAAHSAACPLIAHWAAGAAARALDAVQAALLVAPSDPAGPNYPKGPTGFNPVPRRRLPFASIVVASTNDPFVALARAREYASCWGAALVVLEMPATSTWRAASAPGRKGSSCWPGCGQARKRPTPSLQAAWPDSSSPVRDDIS